MKNLLIAFIYIAWSTSSFAQGSITWTGQGNIAANMYGNEHPRITTDANGNPLVIWGKQSTKEAMFSRWTGTSFSMPVTLNPPSIPVFAASWAGPDMASRGDTIYAVYKGTPEDTCHIYLVSSFNGGVSFSPPARVDFIADSVSRFPTVTIDASGNPVVAFMKFNSTFGEARWAVTRSTDFGLTFLNDVLASGWSGGAVCDCCPGSIISSGNDMIVLYRDNLNNIRDSYAALSVNGGASFSSGWNVDQNAWMLMMCPATGPDGIVFGDSLYAVFMTGASGSNRVYWSSSSISGSQASPSQPVTGAIPGLTVQNYPRIAQSGNAVAMTWKQQVSGTDQLALRFTNDISAGFPLSYDTVDLGDVTNTDVVLTNGNIFVVWEDDNSGTIKYRTGTFSPVNTAVPSVASQDHIIVFPNPSNGEWTISNAGERGAMELTLFNTLGMAVRNLVIIDDGRIRLKNDDLTNGVYYLQIKYPSKTRVIKLVKG